MTSSRGEHLGTRQTAEIPAKLHEEFSVLVRDMEHTGAYMFWCWLKHAVIDARLGRPLPAHQRAPHLRTPGGQRERQAKIRWKQSDDEYDQWTAELERVGSSPSAVLRARITAYVQANGDPIAAELGPRTPSTV